MGAPKSSRDCIQSDCFGFYLALNLLIIISNHLVLTTMDALDVVIDDTGPLELSVDLLGLEEPVFLLAILVSVVNHLVAHIADSLGKNLGVLVGDVVCLGNDSDELGDTLLIGHLVKVLVVAVLLQVDGVLVDRCEKVAEAIELRHVHDVLVLVVLANPLGFLDSELNDDVGYCGDGGCCCVFCCFSHKRAPFWPLGPAGGGLWGHPY